MPICSHAFLVNCRQYRSQPNTVRELHRPCGNVPEHAPTSAYVLASSLSVARIPTRCGARPAKRSDAISLISSVLNGTWTLDAVIWTPCGVDMVLMRGGR